jgi:hypothetical protein
MAEYSLKKFEFTKTKNTSSQYSTIIGDGGGNTMRNGYTNNRIERPIYTANDIETFTERTVFNQSMTHTLPTEQVKDELKNQMMRQMFSNMVRHNMFEFYESIDTETFGVNINCRLKVVKPLNNVVGRFNP